jgi:hypothetical protein
MAAASEGLPRAARTSLTSESRATREAKSGEAESSMGTGRRQELQAQNVATHSAELGAHRGSGRSCTARFQGVCKGHRCDASFSGQEARR